MPRRLPPIAATLAAGLACAAVRADTWTPSMRADDPRLGQRVTLAVPHASIDVFLARLASTCGIALAPELRDGAGDPEVAVFLRDLPVADAMEALASLVSYKDARWFWEREGKPGAYEYRLLRPLAAQQFGARMRERVLAALDDELSTCAGALDLPPDKRNALAKTDKRVARTNAWDLRQAAIRMLAGLPPEDRTGLIREGRVIGRTVGELGPAAREFARIDWRLRHPRGPSAPASDEALDAIKLWLHRVSQPDVPSPFVLIEVGDGGGIGFLGGPEFAADEYAYLNGLWILPGDAASGAAESRAVAAATPPPLVPVVVDAETGDGRTLKRRLAELSEAADVSVMVRLPLHPFLNQQDPGPVRGPTLLDDLRRLGAGVWGLQHKWHGDVLMLCSQRWPWEEDEVPPARVVRRLTESATANQGILPLREVAWAADQCNGKQLLRLARRFPPVGLAAQCPEFFAKMDRDVVWAGRLLGPVGVPMSSVPASALSVRGFVDRIGRAPEPDDLVRLRLIPHGGLTEYAVWVTRANGEFVCGHGSIARPMREDEDAP